MKIAIDGPAGAGKSTIARLVAGELGYTYVDTGAMYRALTLEALQRNIPSTDGKQLAETLVNMNLQIKAGSKNSGNQIFVNGKNVTMRIRDPIVSENVSAVSSHQEVRQAAVSIQRQLALHGDVVMDGRDIGTVVMPDADRKFFLQASVTERAKRRQVELIRKGYDIDLSELEEQIRRRDLMDTTREISPLLKADDAIEIDTTNLTVPEVVELVLCYCQGGDSCV